MGVSALTLPVNTTLALEELVVMGLKVKAERLPQNFPRETALLPLPSKNSMWSRVHGGRPLIPNAESSILNSIDSAPATSMIHTHWKFSCG
jgi:hypothetical protein